VVAKSLGTLALPLAVARALPGVWLTPILTEASIATAVRNLSAPSLLVGGTKDRLWDAEVARQSAADVLELEGANHALEFGESVEPSLATLQQVVARVATFVSRQGH
jgi:predicted alpha/beta-hydrolase family hydrolase